MNFDPSIPTSSAIVLGLVAASMWGTWFINLKYLGDFPLEGFYITLFVTSMILVWGVGFLLDGSSLITNLVNIWNADPSRIVVTFLCGAIYVGGMQFSLRVINIIGLSLSQPLQASINLIGGTLLSGLIGGVPEGMTIMRVAIAIFFLFLAIFLTMKAGNTRNTAQLEKKIDNGLSRDPKEIRKALIWLIIGAAFVPAYSTALSYGLKTITQPNGMAVMPFMTMLCSGAFTGAMIICGTTLTIQRKWHFLNTFSLKYLKYGIYSGLAHYGGNIIHTFATRSLSSVVSWPLGITSGLWTQMWGLVYGEFKGSPKKTYVYLFSGILCYLIGAFVISNVL